MNDLVSTQALPGSQIQCRETNEEMVFYLPPHAIRAWIRAVLLVAALVVWVGFWTGLVYSGGWLPFAFIAVPAGILGCLAWAVCFHVFAGSDLTKTWMHITPDRLVLKTTLCGWQQARTYHLNERSCAKQYWGTPVGDAPDEPSGIVVTSDADPSLGKDTAHFGVSLSRCELEWVEWRINRFLGHATDADAPTGVTASPETE